MDYVHRRIESLTELKPGDHIVVEESRASIFGRRKTHHLLVVVPINHTHAWFIHCVSDSIGGVEEEKKRYSPRHVTVLDYETGFTQKAIIERAEGMMLKNEPQSGSSNCWRNSEDFVIEARTGTKKSFPSFMGLEKIGQTAARGGAGVGVGAVVGGVIGSFVPVIGTAIGAGVGGLIGGVGGGAGSSIVSVITSRGQAGKIFCSYIHV